MPIPGTRTRENRRGYPPGTMHPAGILYCTMPRPKTLAPNGETTNLVVRLDERDLTRLQRVAKRRGMTVSALVREQVQELLAS